MFENTLLIIKPDFMPNRKSLLLHLLSKRFQIQGNRKLAFTPEDAGEFYKHLADDKCYMLYVIMLAKGTSEAFILTKTNAAEELVDTMICYFGTSMEMDRNIHVSRNVCEARREITFIFPNYIHEPIEFFDKHKFNKQPVIAPLLREAFNIIKKSSEDPQENWRCQFSDFLLKKNEIFPQISNQCSRSPQIAFQEKYQQTDITMLKGVKDAAERLSLASVSTIPGASSDLMSSSSCISCGSFKSVDPCTTKDQLDEFERRLEVRAKKTLEDDGVCLKEESQNVCEEYIEWGETLEEGEMSEGGDKFERDEEVIVIKEELCVEHSSTSVVAVQTIVMEVISEETPQIIEVPEEPPPAEGEAIIAEIKAQESIKKDEEPVEPVVKSADEPYEGSTIEIEVAKEPETQGEQTTEPAVEPTSQVEESEAAPPEDEAPPQAE